MPGRAAARYAAAVFIVICTSLIAELLFRALHTTRLSPVLLAGVVIAAVNLGSGPAYLTAALSFGVYNFYLADPRFSFSLQPEDVMILVVFLIVALLTGRLAGRLRDHERASNRRSVAQGVLLEATRDFAGIVNQDGIRDALVRHLAGAAASEVVIIAADGTSTSSEPVQRTLDHDSILKITADELRDLQTSRLAEWRARALRVGGQQLGIAAWRSSNSGQTQVVEDAMIDLLIDLGAGSLLRARLSEERSEIEALARTERLRATLLSSLSHDLRTPLASILASTGSLRQFGERLAPNIQADLILTIEEEAERLNLFVDNLLNMSRLEAGALKVRSESIRLEPIVERVIERCRSRKRARTVVRAGFADIHVLGDGVLLEQALINVLENAYRFSPDGSAVELAAWRSAEDVVIEVADEGPGVPDDELGRIFEKFFRCRSSEKVPGTGLGLSITKGLIEAMDGSVEACPREDEQGLRVRVTLPVGP